MSETPLLALPLIAAEQAQKHVTLNEALNALDALVQLAVKDRDQAAPPGSPAEGDRYIVAAGASGAWTGRDLDIAAWQSGAWSFYTPQEGWRCFVADEDAMVVFDGSAWNDATVPLASETEAGIVELATFTETREGTLDERAVPPSALGAFAAFRATKVAATQNVANTTVTVITYENEVFDVGAYYDTATSRWTPPAGVVALMAGFRFTNASLVDGARYSLGFLKNGASIFQETALIDGTAQPQGMSTMFFDECDGDDTYEVYVQQLSGGTLVVDNTGVNAHFAGTRLR